MPREWIGHPEWAQVGANIQRECALVSEHFQSLLSTFADELAAATLELTVEAQIEAWCRACKAHELRGPPIAAEARPTVLGRASRVGGLARAISSASGGHLSEDKAERGLRKYAGKPRLPPRFDAPLRAAPLGRDILWATFHPKDRRLDPFSCLPDRAAPVRCALGLGYHPEREEVVTLVYGTDGPAHGRPIHRPTVADANSYTYYRPYHDAAADHGYTATLRPNEADVPPMPEVVHAQITGAALILPYRILV